MKLKLVSLTALTALALGGVALAQDQNAEGAQRRGGGGGMRHDPMERITEKLNLTADQKAKIQPILDEAKPKMEEIHRDAMQKSKALMDETKGKIRPLLTPEQQKTLDEAKDNRASRRGGRHGGAGGDDDNG